MPGVRTAFQQLDRHVGSRLSGGIRRYRSSPAVLRAESSLAHLQFEIGRQKRRRRYRSLSPGISEPDVIQQLQRDGVAVLPGAVDPVVLIAIREEFETCLADAEHLNPPSNDTVRPPDDLTAPTTFLTGEDLAGGEGYWRTMTNYVSVDEPFLHCPSTVDIALGDRFIDLAGGYLGCLPAIGGVNLRRSYANNLPGFDTLHFHSDRNSARFLKFFFYLNDVDEKGGPFCYVLGSNRRKFPGWRGKYRWTKEEIEAVYGPEQVVYLTARMGDVVVADTTGLHRGTKVHGADRSMLTVDYVVDPEFGGTAPATRIGARHYDSLPPRQRAVADLLEPVPDLDA